MVSLAQRRVDVSFLAAVLEMLVIVAVSSVWASLSEQIELIAAAVSSSLAVSALLWFQWRRMKRGAASTFQPEMMPAIVAALVVTRACSAALPETMPNVAAFSLELLCALVAGGVLGFVLTLPVVRKVATAAARSLL